MSSDCGRNLEYPERSRADLGRTYKDHTERRFKPRTLLLQTTMPQRCLNVMCILMTTNWAHGSLLGDAARCDCCAAALFIRLGDLQSAETEDNTTSGWTESTFCNIKFVLLHCGTVIISAAFFPLHCITDFWGPYHSLWQTTSGKKTLCHCEVSDTCQHPCQCWITSYFKNIITK